MVMSLGRDPVSSNDRFALLNKLEDQKQRDLQEPRRLFGLLVCECFFARNHTGQVRLMDADLGRKPSLVATLALEYLGK